MIHPAWLLPVAAFGAVVGLAFDRPVVVGLAFDRPVVVATVVVLWLVGKGARRWLRTERYIEEGHGPW